MKMKLSKVFGVSRGRGIEGGVGPVVPPHPDLLPEEKETPSGSLLAAMLWTASSAAVVAVLLCGCTVLSYTSPTGERFTRGSFGANTSIQSVALEAGTNGARRIELRGYQTDQTQALGAITEAAIKAAVQSAK
jgi:hypothetical protein